MALGQDLATPTTLEEAQAFRQRARGQIQGITAHIEMYDRAAKAGRRVPHWMARDGWRNSAAQALAAKERRVEHLNRWILNMTRHQGIPENPCKEASPDDPYQMLAACWTILRDSGRHGVFDPTLFLGYADEIRDHLRRRAPQYAERDYFMSIMDGKWVLES